MMLSTDLLLQNRQNFNRPAKSRIRVPPGPHKPLKTARKRGLPCFFSYFYLKITTLLEGVSPVDGKVIGSSLPFYQGGKDETGCQNSYSVLFEPNSFSLIPTHLARESKADRILSLALSFYLEASA